MESKIIGGFEFVPYHLPETSPALLLEKSETYRKSLDQRRSVREFSDQNIPLKVIENIILTASSAPSGAHKQPWHFCIVKDPLIKKEIRIAAEKEEYESYNGRMSEAWLEELRPFQTNWQKEFLEVAPYLIIAFKKVYDIDEEGKKHNNYYVAESVGLACGFLLTAIHQAGLVALTHTPNPMNFLTHLLKRPENERPFLLIPVGYPASECYVPKLKRKTFKEIATVY